MRNNKSRFHQAYALILLLAAGLYLLISFRDAIWQDEAYTFAMVHHSFGDMWRITAADVHPPLYYLLVKPFTAVFGYSQFSGRLFSGIWYLALLAVSGIQLKKLFDEKTALLFMVLFLVFPYSLSYAPEVRMYSLAAFCVTVNAIYAYRAWKFNQPLDWAIFAVAGTSAAYTHYFALVSAGLIYGLLFLCILAKNRKLLKPWLLASIVTIVLYLPWLKSFVEQLAFKVSNDYWIEPIGISTLVDYVLGLFYAGGVATWPFFMGVVCLVALVMALRGRDVVSLLALVVPVGTVALGVLVSILIRPIFVMRYLAPSAPLLIFFLAKELGSVKKERIAVCLLSVIMVGCLSNLLFEVRSVTYDYGTLDGGFAAEYADADCYVVSSKNSHHISQTLAYYASDKDVYVPDTLGADNPYTNKHQMDELDLTGMHKVIVLTTVGKAPEDSLTQGFRAEFVDSVYDVYNAVDVWVLTK